MPAAPWDWYNPITSTTLTGRGRTRRQKWTGKHIIQVEVRGLREGVPESDIRRIDFFWRDATHLDLVGVFPLTR